MRNRQRTATSIAIILILALSGTACGEQARDAVQKMANEAREKLHEESIDLSAEGVAGKVELTPGGDLLIDGEAVAMDSTQREAALAYREKLLAVADAGLAVGQHGASLGGEAAALALGALLGGKDIDTAEMERKIEAEAEGIKSSARALCRHALALQAEQARFAKIVPEFAPYAKHIDIDADCEDVDDDSVATAPVRA